MARRSTRCLLAKVTGMKLSLQDIHRTVDYILQATVDHRREEGHPRREAPTDNVEENLVDVLIGLQGKG